MNKQLNLLGVRKLRLIEAVENQIINYQWVDDQLYKAGFPTKNINGNFQIGCKSPLLTILVTYNNSNNKTINAVEIQTSDKFPLIKQQTIKLQGNELTTQNLVNKILNLIPSTETLQEDLENIPTQSMTNFNQFYEIKKYLDDNFKIKEDIISDDSGLIWELTYTRYIIKVVLNKGDKPYYEPQFKAKNANNKGRYYFNDLESLMKSLEKNLGIQDLTSKLYITNDIEQEEESEKQERIFDRNANLTKEEQALRKQLSDEVNKILNSVNEDYDSKNINIWNLAYSKCKSDKEKDILIQLFMNKKMNVKAQYIERNFLGLRQWVNNRGFDINKNLGLRFVDIYTSLYPNQEIPSGSLIVLTDLTNRKIIYEERNSNNLLFDKTSILYVKNIYNNLNNNYNNLIDAFKMYHDVYIMGPLKKEKQEILLDNFKFLTPEIVSKTYNLAYVMCINNDNLRDINTIETIYSVITDKTRADLVDKPEYDKNLKDIMNDWRKDKKLDSLPETDPRTLRLVQDAINTALSKNRQAQADFEASLGELNKK